MYKIEDDMLVYNGVRYSYADAKEYGLIALIEAEEAAKAKQAAAKAAPAPEDKADEPEEDKAAPAPANKARATARA